MKILSYTEARKNFAQTLDAVEENADVTIIHRAGHEPVVLLSLSEWQSIRETEYLLSDPKTAQQLRDGIAELDAGRGQVHALIEVDDE